jgi:hypothetical protein
VWGTAGDVWAAGTRIVHCTSSGGCSEVAPPCLPSDFSTAGQFTGIWSDTQSALWAVGYDGSAGTIINFRSP